MSQLTFDLTGARDENHVVEILPKDVGHWDLLVPTQRPFFTQTLVLTDHRTGYVLKPNKDFVAIHRLEEYSARAQSEICCFIVLLDRKYSSTLTVDYYSLGQVPSSAIPSQEQVEAFAKTQQSQPYWGMSVTTEVTGTGLESGLEHYGHLIKTLDTLNRTLSQGDVEFYTALKQQILVKHQNVLSQLQQMGHTKAIKLSDDRQKLIDLVRGKYANAGDGIVHNKLKQLPCLKYEEGVVTLPRPIHYRDYAAHTVTLTIERLDENDDVVYAVEEAYGVGDFTFPLVVDFCIESDGQVLNYNDWLTEFSGKYRFTRTNEYGGITRSNNIVFPPVIVDTGEPSHRYVDVLDAFLEVASITQVDQPTINRWMATQAGSLVILKYMIADTIINNHPDPDTRLLATRWIQRNS